MSKPARMPFTERVLAQLTLVRFREFIREPDGGDVHLALLQHLIFREVRGFVFAEAEFSPPYIANTPFQRVVSPK